MGNIIISILIPFRREKFLNVSQVIDEYFDPQLDLVLDIDVMVSERSTIVDLTEDEYIITRQGKGEIHL